MSKQSRGLVASVVGAAVCAAAGASHAQAPADPLASAFPVSTPRADASEIDRISAQIAVQARLLAQQQATISAQAQRIDALQKLSEQALAAARAAGAPGAASTDAPVQLVQDNTQQVGATPVVGEAPPERPRIEIASIPDGSGVLTPKGHFTVEPSLDYTHGSTNRLVFRGVEIVTGIQIGVIEASDADRNAASGAVAVRYGLTNRLEVEARVPYLYRADRVTTLAQQSESATRTDALTGYSLGDIELAGRYQLNNGKNGWPIFIANLRAKSATGVGPFDVNFDSAGVATSLATGSGFWSIEPGITFLYPTDPAVVFGGITYLANIGKNIGRTVGDVPVGRVNPGNSIGLNAGFGFALNPRFSFSLSYAHNYIFPTTTELGGTLQKSTSLQVGTLGLGWSFRLNDRMTVSTTYNIGTTRDAPDMEFVVRLPYRF